jgi:hypothetical protein
MKHKYSLMAALAGLALLTVSGNASQAGDWKAGMAVKQDAAGYEKIDYRKKSKTRVYGYSARRGGYSYSPEDVVNTYGLTRNKYGSTNSFRDPWSDRQTIGGPFDHGFFFDSANSPRGGDSPYLH